MALAKRNSKEPMKDFPIWRTLTLGKTATNAHDFLELAKQKGIHVSKNVTTVLPFVAFSKPQVLDLVLVTSSDLGDSCPATTEAICSEVAHFGLMACPPDTAFLLALEFEEEKGAEMFFIPVIWNEKVVGIAKRHVINNHLNAYCYLDEVFTSFSTKGGQRHLSSRNGVWSKLLPEDSYTFIFARQ